MFAGLKRLKLKVTIAIYVLIAVILLLLAFSIYVKVRQVQSVDYIQHQSASTSEMSVLLQDISSELQGLRKETCLQRMGTTADSHPNCEN